MDEPSEEIPIPEPESIDWDVVMEESQSSIAAPVEDEWATPSKGKKDKKKRTSTFDLDEPQEEASASATPAEAVLVEDPVIPQMESETVSKGMERELSAT